MASTSAINSGKVRSTSTSCSGAPGRPSSRCSIPPNSRLASISKLQRCSDSRYRCWCSNWPTSSSNEGALRLALLPFPHDAPRENQFRGQGLQELGIGHRLMRDIGTPADQKRFLLRADNEAMIALRYAIGRHVNVSSPQCPDSEVRIISRRLPLRTSESKDTGKLLILVWLWFRSPHDEVAAQMMRTSEPKPHQCGGQHIAVRVVPNHCGADGPGQENMANAVNEVLT